MKKIIVLSCSIFLIFNFLNCSNNVTTPPITTINIDFRNEVDISNSLTTNYFKSRKLIKLETTKESLISRISRLIVFDNKYYIFDHQTKSIYIFNEFGKYISKIKRVGKGPGEYIQLTDFTIDTKNKQLILLCDIPNCLIYFDLNGTYIKQEQNGKWNKYISACQNSIFFASILVDDNENYIRVKNESEYAEFLPIEKYIRDKDFYSPHPNIIRSDYTYFFKVYDNLIYELSDNNVVTKYQINFGEKFVDKSIIENNDLEKISKISIEKQLICRINDFRESNNYLTFGMWPFNKIVIYNKKEKIGKLFSKFYDPETGLYLSEIIAHDGTGDEMMFIVQPMLFINNVLHIKNAKEVAQNQNYIRYKEVANALTDTDNPILMVYGLK